MLLKGKILIIEDDAYIRELYEEILNKEGFDVVTAKNGEEGLAKFTESKFDLVFLDIMMPTCNGIDFLKNLKKQKRELNDTPIIILTNLGYETVIKEAVSYGASDYLIKSDLTPDELINKVSQFIKQ